MEIELVKESDLKACADISIRAWKETYEGIVDKEYLDSLDVQVRFNKFKNNYQMAPFLVAKINDEVVGFCRYIDDLKIEEYPRVDSELTVLYVKPELKNKGIGTALFSYVKDKLKEKNKHGMLISCIKGNKIGESFYHKMNGEIIGEREIEIGGKKYKELVFYFEL
ncbi:MAG: GNAT family N-acetyltransferase [Ruminococcus sp.]|nr:GNAT family N-acetyltransferase [Ruminococcus sp.]